MAKKKAKQIYGVSVGRERGIFHSWEECKKQVHKFPKAKFKGFDTLKAAQQFIGVFASDSGQQEPEKAKPLPVKRKAPPIIKEPDVIIPEDFKPSAAKRPRVQSSSKNSAKISNNWQVCISFDGGARGNPGVAGSGAEVVITERTPQNFQKHRRKIHARKFVGPKGTCNMAEWQGVLSGLLQLVEQVEKFRAKNGYIQPKMEMFVQGDSQLVIRQLEGTYRCNNPVLRKLKGAYDAAMRKLNSMTESLTVSYEHVYRIDNKVADGLANEAMDAQRSWVTETADSSDEESSEDEAPPPRPKDENVNEDVKPKKVYAEV